MKKLAMLVVFFLVYEQTAFNVVPCGNPMQEIKSTVAGERVFVAQACIEKHVRELSRQKFKNRKLAEKAKILTEANGYGYRIEEAQK